MIFCSHCNKMVPLEFCLSNTYLLYGEGNMTPVALCSDCRKKKKEKKK